MGVSDGMFVFLFLFLFIFFGLATIEKRRWGGGGGLFCCFYFVVCLDKSVWICVVPDQMKLYRD
jgi:hypothetical protein